MKVGHPFGARRDPLTDTSRRAIWEVTALGAAFKADAMAAYEPDLYEALQALDQDTEETVLRTLADVPERRASYLWRPYIPATALTAVRGDSGSGKTWFIGKVTAAVTSGGTLPDGIDGTDVHLDAAPVLLLQRELDEAEMLVPRMKALGADPSQVIAPGTGVLSHFRFEDEPEPYLRLAWLLERIRKERGQLPAFIYIDPITSFLAETIKQTDVRSALERLAVVAAYYSVPILFVQHFNKAQGTSAKYRGSGSMEFFNVARSVIDCAEDRKLEREDSYEVHLAAFQAKRTAARGRNLGWTLSGEVGNPDRPLSWTWREVDQERTIDDIAAEEFEAARGGAAALSSAYRTRLAMLTVLSTAGSLGEATLDGEDLKARILELDPEASTSGTTWRRAYAGRPERGMAPAPIRPVETAEGRWIWPTLRPSEVSVS